MTDTLRHTEYRKEEEEEELDRIKRQILETAEKKLIR